MPHCIARVYNYVCIVRVHDSRMDVHMFQQATGMYVTLNHNPRCLGAICCLAMTNDDLTNGIFVSMSNKTCIHNTFKINPLL